MQPFFQNNQIIRHAGTVLASIGLLLLMIGCSELLESKRTQNTMKIAENTSVSKTDKIYRFPLIDADAPVKTETATFALG